MSEEETDTRSWFLRIASGVVFGPVPTKALRLWAEQGRVQPGNEISLDRKNWIPAPSLEELDIVWYLEDNQGNLTGPFNKRAAEKLIADGRVGEGTSIIHKDDADLAHLVRPAMENRRKKPSGGDPELDFGTEDDSAMADENALRTECEGLRLRISVLEKSQKQLLAAAEKECKSHERQLEAERSKVSKLEAELEETRLAEAAARNAARAVSTQQESAGAEATAKAEAALAEANAKHEAEIAELEAKHKAELTEAEAKAKAALAELEDKHRSELDEAEAKAKAALTEAEARHKDELDEAKAKSEAALAELEAKHKDELAEAAAKAEAALTEREASLKDELAATKAELSEANAKAETAIAEANARHEAEIGELTDKHTNELAEAEAKSESALAELEARHKDELAAAQAELSESNAKAETAIAEANARREAEIAELEAKRQDELADAKAKSEAALAELETRHKDELAAAKAELAEASAKAEAALANANAKHESTVAELTAKLAEAANKFESLQAEYSELLAFSNERDAQAETRIAELSRRPQISISEEADKVFASEIDYLNSMFDEGQKRQKQVRERIDKLVAIRSGGLADAAERQAKMRAEKAANDRNKEEINNLRLENARNLQHAEAREQELQQRIRMLEIDLSQTKESARDADELRQRILKLTDAVNDRDQIIVRERQERASEHQQLEQAQQALLQRLEALEKPTGEGEETGKTAEDKKPDTETPPSPPPRKPLFHATPWMTFKK